MFHKELAEKHPEIIVRAYQLAFDVCYNKQSFKEQDLCNIFENKFTIYDFAGFNNGVTDISTFLVYYKLIIYIVNPGLKNR
jgi:hypothetical protein